MESSDARHSEKTGRASKKFRGEIIVVKFGGSALEDLESTQSIMEDISFMACMGMRPVVDSSHAIIDSEIVAEGTLNVNTVYPREIIKKALEYHAAALILAHNHPSGNPEPSQADIALTGRLKDSLALIDVRVLDHFIVGSGEPVSFSERGLI